MLNQVSVCMTAYNGENYIESQILSIMSQLTQNDELIIVNDCSKDQTIEIIQSIQDSRIKVINNETNIGIVRAFEKSIAAASGDIIFLSDQDDLWADSKVERVTSAFRNNSDITLIVTDALLIDSDGRFISESFFKELGGFSSGFISNIIKNRYHGCTIAFKKDMLEFILPFPNNLAMHDIWIGMCNILYGKTLYINEPLIQYRRHGKNHGPGIYKIGLFNNTNLFKVIGWRVSLIVNILRLIGSNNIFIKKKE